ncbi:WD40-repeat-containing domain protein [Kalaharituber pfeilii]|nr:WD40-repeat-containing domain protein [Kalaharituber pfeilii]
MAGIHTPSINKSSGNPGLKLTPSNSTSNFLPRGSQARTPNNKVRNTQSETGLYLRRVIGCSTTAFDSHPASRSFAYTAGAAAVVVQLDESLQITQRFFRARPNAPTWSSASSQVNSIQSSAFLESRSRLSQSLKDLGIGYSTSLATPFSIEDSPSSKTWTARERIKAATCVSFSPDGRWLAVGETGYNPRVLIFTMSKDVPSDIPVAVMSEHTFGVRDVAFSPCSKYLASIGTINDGFVYIWALTPSNKGNMVKLHSSNKCTSPIRGIAWMGKNLVTVGLRHVKVWKVEEEPRPASPGTKVLSGRNALLGSMVDYTMTCVVGISEDKALVCSERGDICLLDESQLQLRLLKIANAEFGVSCITIDAESKFAWVAGKNGNIRALVLKEIVPSTPPPLSPSSSRSGSPVLPYGCRPANVTAMASMLGHLFTLDSNHSIKIINVSTCDGVPVPNSMVRELPAHKDAVLGVRLLPPTYHSGASFFTWSAGGLVLFWSLEGINQGDFMVELEQPSEGEDDIANELKVVRVSPMGDYFITGDKYGVLRVVDSETYICLYGVKAHSSEIMDIAIYQHEKTNIVVSCARDRTVQVFQRTGEIWGLIQTLDDHTASVSKVLLLENGSKLLSCSADRTVVIRELVQREADGAVSSAYLPIRTLVLKASPLHMTPVSDNLPHLLVSSMDRQVHKFDLNTGKTLQSFKTTDDTNDAVVMDCIGLSKERVPGGRRILAGISTTDKSIRIYDLNGNLIDKEWGHTEGVSDVALLETGSEDNETDTMMVISTGTDGTIMIWEFNPRSNDGSSSESSVSSKPELTATKTPIRRILSKSELNEFTPKTADKDIIAGAPSGVNSANNSPPRVKKRNSMYGMNKTLPMAKIGQGRTDSARTDSGDSSAPNTPVFGSELNASTPTSSENKKASRERSLSPPETTKPSASRRPSNEAKSRGKGTANVNGNANGGLNGIATNANSNDVTHVNNLAESLVRSLRTFREGIVGNARGGIRPEVLKELEKELGLTSKELGEKTHRKRNNNATNIVNEQIMTQLLDQYSERLMSMIGSRLEEKLSKEASQRGRGQECKNCEELTGQG